MRRPLRFLALAMLVAALAAASPTAGAQPPPPSPGVTVVSGSRDASVDIDTPSPQTIAKLDLYAGRWVVWAKLTVGEQSQSLQFLMVTCDLGAGASQRHTAETDVMFPEQPVGEQTMELSQVVTLPIRGGGTAVVLRCKGETKASRIRMMAMRIGTLTQVDITAQTQTVAGQGPPFVVHGQRDISMPVPGESDGLVTVGQLPLAAGNWWIHVTLPLATNLASHDLEVTVDCMVQAGAENDSGATRLWGHIGRSHTAVMDLTHHFASPGTARIRCASDAPAGRARIDSVRITAIKVGALTEEVFFGGGRPTTTGAGSPRVIAGADGGAMSIDDDGWRAVESIDLSSTTWMMVAKLSIKPPETILKATCRLVAVSGNASDTATTGSFVGERTLTMRVAAKLGSFPEAHLACRNDTYPGFDGDVFVVDRIHITALRVTTLLIDPL